MDAEVRLKIVAGPQIGREFRFDAHDTFIFGRSAECHSSLPDDAYISSRHFLIEVNPPDCVLRDLGSKNGTRVNGVLSGQRARGEAAELAADRAQVVPLKDGDKIKAGRTEFSVSVRAGDLPPAPKTATAVPSGAPGSAQPGFMTGFLAGIAKNIKPEGPPSIQGYTLGKMLKAGGMGEVYLAKRIKDGVAVVVKVIKPQGAKATEKQVQYFKREMDVSILGLEAGHRNIVKFLGSGLADTIFYFIMEYYPEGSVFDLMEAAGGSLPIKQAVNLTGQALDGLAYAHGLNIVHRDLKPENILLAKENGALVAKVADFGLAKNFVLSGMSGITTGSELGSGTPQFMPKEQLLEFRETKPVSDVFAMGATLYNMLTGEFVYDGKDYVVSISNGKVVPIRKRGVDLPRALMEVVDKATAPEARDRYQTAVEFKAALRAAAE